jgi:hypothetical protein
LPAYISQGSGSERNRYITCSLPCISTRAKSPSSTCSRPNHPPSTSPLLANSRRHNFGLENPSRPLILPCRRYFAPSSSPVLSLCECASSSVALGAQDDFTIEVCWMPTYTALHTHTSDTLRVFIDVATARPLQSHKCDRTVAIYPPSINQQRTGNVVLHDGSLHLATSP